LIIAIVRKELLAVLRDGRLLALAFSVFAVLTGFFLASASEHRQIQLEKQAVGATAKQQWDTQGVKNPHAAAHFGIYVFKPDSPLASVDPGLRQYTGQSLWLEPHKRNGARFSPAADQGLAGRFGQVSAGFVLYALLPLLVIALAFNAVTLEREQGTLRMLHSLGVSATQLLLGKFIGLLLAFVVVLMPAMLIAVIILYHNFDLAGDDVLRLFALSGTFFIYYAVFAALAMSMSIHFKSSRLALFALLAFWSGSVLIAPRLGATAAEMLIPMPSATEFWAAIKNDIQQGLGNDGDHKAREAAFNAQVLKQFGVKKVEELPVGYTALKRHFNDGYSERVHALHFDRLRDAFERQGRFIHIASLLGPTIAMRSVSMTLSGMDLAHQRHFEDAAEHYRHYFIGLTDDWDRERSHGTGRGAQGHDSDWGSVKAFGYTPPSISFALHHALFDLLVLLAWLVAALMWLLFSAKRLKP
jgi:ABC-2 type transport system permease protein